MSGATKLMTAGGGGVSLTPASSIASDVTVNVPVTGVSGGTLVCSDSSGNVGIGTSSPDNVMTTYRGAGVNNYIHFTNSTTGTASTDGCLIGVSADDTALRLRVLEASPMLFTTSDTERMRIDSSGNLLVGTTASPSATVSGTMLSASVASTANRVSAGNTTGGTALFAFYNANGVVGSVVVSGSSTAFNTSSDYRLKENIQPMQNALATVAQLNPVTYTWKADGSDGQGFIAHELQAVVPDCVTGEKDAVDEDGKPVYQGIDTSFLVATLTKAIQEQQAQIETLTAKVAALEAK